ncbi:MAG TPA: aminotransferase class III-fold pyridoxal phosphate-dependent enzyme, partial [Chthoniobacterales bacterium]
MEMSGDMKAVKIDRLSDIRKLFQRNVVPTYARFDLALDHGEGSHVFDVAGKRYLDLGGGIAVCALGHANPEITDALLEQSRKLLHVSNLYFTKPQAQLAEALVRLIGPGRCFFCNSGAEANEGLYKLSRKFGHDEGRYEIVSTDGSFHGRTLAGIAATGQEKVKKGFEPMVAGFRQVPFNDLKAMEAAITRETAAILIEAIQGESGITAATPEYLLGLRKLCDERCILLLLDEVQGGHFRTGRFHAWQRLLENVGGDFQPDAISMAKSLGGGFPIGAFWVREKYSDLLSAGTHATTFGGNPLG